MRFLDTNEIENLEKDLDNNELPLTAENLELELARLQAIKDKLPSKYSLSIELMSIDEARSLAPYGVANPFKKLKVAIAAQNRYKVAQKRYNKAVELIGEIDSRIEDMILLKEYWTALPEYKSYSDKVTVKANDKVAECDQLGQ